MFIIQPTQKLLGSVAPWHRIMKGKTIIKNSEQIVYEGMLLPCDLVRPVATKKKKKKKTKKTLYPPFSYRERRCDNTHPGN
jgi:hypothetical protein